MHEQDRQTDMEESEAAFVIFFKHASLVKEGSLEMKRLDLQRILKNQDSWVGNVPKTSETDKL